jgi:hypothetical protein
MRWRARRSSTTLPTGLRVTSESTWSRTASGEERTRLWELMASIWPEYNRYQERTDREIPVVVIERA